MVNYPPFIGSREPNTMKQQCSECGETHEVCPECESRMFTPQERHGTPDVRRFLMDANDGETQEYKDVCWECGYTRYYEVTVDEIHDN